MTSSYRSNFWWKKAKYLILDLNLLSYHNLNYHLLKYHLNIHSNNNNNKIYYFKINNSITNINNNNNNNNNNHCLSLSHNHNHIFTTLIRFTLLFHHNYHNNHIHNKSIHINNSSQFNLTKCNNLFHCISLVDVVVHLMLLLLNVAFLIIFLQQLIPQ